MLHCTGEEDPWRPLPASRALSPKLTDNHSVEQTVQSHLPGHHEPQGEDWDGLEGCHGGFDYKEDFSEAVLKALQGIDVQVSAGKHLKEKPNWSYSPAQPFVSCPTSSSSIIFSSSFLSCISYLLLHNKLPQKLRANTYYLPISMGQEPGSNLAESSS